jgi:4-amino-4-deoxy-L-arabinose transferase-like glycosyltransferase
MKHFASRFGPNGDVEVFLKRWGLLILTAFALCYYGYYCRCWPGPGGEGGLIALLSQRLLQGQRPIIDMFLGYNVLWFYPVVGIFQVMGPSYIAMRIFFFLLCAITGLLSYRLVLKCTGRAWPALLAGVLVILIPGQTYRNYMAFLVVLNMTVFLSAYVLAARSEGRRLVWMALCGVTLGIAYLIRIDVGYFLTFILLGLILLYPVGKRGTTPLSRRITMAAAGLLLALGGLILTHLPVYLDASKRGFGPEFAAQYRQWPETIAGYGRQMFKATSETLSAVLMDQWGRDPVHALPMTPSSNGAAVKSKPPTKAIKITQGAQERMSLTSPAARDRMLALNIYLPIPLSLMALLGAFFAWIAALRRADEEGAARALAVATSLGCSLVLFPQYFFWQPNMVHLSEFMVPMTLTLILSGVFAAEAWKTSGRLKRTALGAYLLLAAISLVLYYINACQSGGSGGIAVSINKTMEFRAANGVCVKMTPQEFEENSSLAAIITAVSSPGEYVGCYPYHPEVNFMTDRPSFEHNLYADNDIPGDVFHRATMAKIAKCRPVAFVINNWEINGTEESRFCNWASETYRHITGNYVPAYRHGNFELYVRPDRADRIPDRFRAQAQAAPTP